MKKSFLTLIAIFGLALSASAQKGKVITKEKKPQSTGVVLETEEAPEKVPVKIEKETPKPTGTGVVLEQEAEPVKTPSKTQIKEKPQIETISNSQKEKVQDVKKKGPSQEKINHAEEKSNGNAFSGKGKGAVKGSQEAQEKAKKEKKEKMNKKPKQKGKKK